MTRLGTLLVLLATGGCVAGSTLEEFDAARSPGGAAATLFQRQGTRHVVELLEVHDSNLLVLADSRVATVPLDRLERIRVHDYRTYTRPFSAPERSEMRLVSRFPYGAPAAAMDSILARAGQPVPDSLP